MDLLRIFLAARSRGEDAVLVLETRNQTISAKYKSAETASGAPAATNTPLVRKRRKNPARVQRSRLRLETFMKRKEDEKNQAETSHAAGRPVDRLVIDLDKDKVGLDGRSVEAGQASPIPQVDGIGKTIPEKVLYTFVSDYHKDDIGYALDELFPEESVELVSCVAPNPVKSADQQCIVAIKRIDDQDVTWPEMDNEQVLVFRELRLK